MLVEVDVDANLHIAKWAMQKVFQEFRDETGTQLLVNNADFGASTQIVDRNQDKYWQNRCLWRRSACYGQNINLFVLICRASNKCCLWTVS